MLPTPVQIVASQSLMFGYRVVGLEGTFPSGADSGPAYQGYGDLIKGFGADWEVIVSICLDYNWMLEGHATFGPGRSILIWLLMKSLYPLEMVTLYPLS